MKSLLLFVVVLIFPQIASAQWKKTTFTGNKDLYDIQVLGSDVYIAGHNSALYKSTDSGKTWSNMTLSIPENLRAIHFTSHDTGFVIGENARIQKTTNAGATWIQKYVRTAAYAYDIQFSGTNGIAVGNDMLIVSSINHGETWAVDTTFASNKKLNSICILPNGICWAVGDSGYMLKKHISKHRWINVKYPTKIHLNYIGNIGDSVLLVCGGMPDSIQAGKSQNIFLRSLDGGNSWATTNLTEMKIINTAYFSTSDSGFLAGSSGIISKSYDPFGKRGQQLTGTASTLNSIAFLNGKGYAVGDGGVLLTTNNQGGYGLPIETTHSNKHAVFPNPGKGQFQIETLIPIQSIDVVDLFGRRIAFEFDWMTSTLNINPNGIFYIRVKFEDGSQTCFRILNLN